MLFQLVLEISNILQFFNELPHGAMERSIHLWVYDPPLGQIVLDTGFEDHGVHALRSEISFVPDFKLVTGNFILRNLPWSHIYMLFVTGAEERYLEPMVGFILEMIYKI